MSDIEQSTCYNPVCEEPISCDPEAREGYCSWECAVMARSGAADRLRREAQ